MSTEDLHPPPVKRRRYVSDSVSHNGTPTATPFWFHDGDIVLEIGQHRFKIHKCRLKCSVIFSDMLEIPQPEVVDSVDGCPLVQLADAAQDWLTALKWMYDPDEFHSMPHPVPWTLIPSALRISTKYEIAALRKWAIEGLRLRWPTDLEHMDTTSLHCAAEAISLARECDVPEILPAAFYALSLQRWSYNADGGRAHLVLSPADMRRLIVGREQLQHVTLHIALNPLAFEHEGPSFDPCPECRDALQQHWRKKVTTSPVSPFDCWLVRQLYAVLSEPDELFERSICARCLNWHRGIAFRRLRALKASIPRFFLVS
ncbi:hypothetical protein AcV7_010076 [Taiwanofungus camphoratus]|nr:hypothetical protein AcV7_010076 [Antrodia cinnamomea]